MERASETLLIGLLVGGGLLMLANRARTGSLLPGATAQNAGYTIYGGATGANGGMIQNAANTGAGSPASTGAGTQQAANTDTTTGGGSMMAANTGFTSGGSPVTTQSASA